MDLAFILGPLGVGIVGAIGAVLKNYANRIDQNRNDLMTKVTESEVRQLIEDKNAVLFSQIRDIHDDLNEIKIKIDRMLMNYAKEKNCK